ncbi:MAG: ribonuclease P protein component [Defluviitaleaceae bacterium]|nr:ribonuclease P protein component [Defluviitaleaceae bacterium]
MKQLPGIRTLKREQFNRIYSKGLYFANKHLVIYVLKNNNVNSLVNTYGISISKKVGKSVVRNRIRRVIKESLRLSQAEIKKGHNIIVVSRTAEKTDFKAIDSSIKKLLKRANLL